jgi:hypothetical protein
MAEDMGKYRKMYMALARTGCETAFDSPELYHIEPQLEVRKR